MKKILRRTFSILLAFALLFGATQLGGAKLVPQAAAEYVSGIYTYEVEDGEATITDVDEDISGDITIPSTIDGYPVTRIGDYAFYCCEDIENVTIPDGVTSIGWSTFAYCTGLTSITIPDSVLSIEGCAFEGCTGLTSIKIPDGITDIGYYAFYNTGYYNDESNWENGVLYIGNHLIEAKDTISGLYKIKAGTKTIAGYAFYDCSNLTGITIPNGVISIGDCAFMDCYGLTNITIPNSVTSIGGLSFLDCIGLTNITISNSVTNIGCWAFSGCIGLTSIMIPDSVTYIGGNAFSFCTGLTSITIGCGVTNIDEYVFEGCTGLTSIIVDKDNAVYDSRDNCNAIIETATNTLAFGCKNTVIPDSVTSIGDNAFYNCSSLINITIPNNITSIGWWAFSGCTDLQEVTISDGVTNIDDFAFYGCSSLTDVTIPDSVTNIGEYAFEKCTALTEIKIPSKLRIIRGDCFSGCTSLTKVIMNDALEIIDYSAFSGCSSLKSVKIPNAVENINGSAFRNCCSLETIDLGNSPELQLGYNTFDGCSGIKEFIVGEDVENYSTDDYGVLYNKNKTGLFRYTTGSEDTEYTVDPNTLFIGRRAFDSTSNLKELTIPRDLMQVDTGAFDEIYSLTDVYYLGSEEEWGEVYIEEYGNDALLDATIHFGSYDEDDVDYAIYVNDLTMNYKESKPLDATVVLGTDTEYTVKYYSDSDNVIVDEDTGMLYGAKRGSASITVEATASDDSIVISSDCKVTVEYTWWQWLIKIVLFGWFWY